MGLKDDVAATQRKSTALERVFEDLSPEDATELRELLEDDLYEGAAIARVLRARGYSVSDRMIQRYRSTLKESL